MTRWVLGTSIVFCIVVIAFQYRRELRARADRYALEARIQDVAQRLAAAETRANHAGRLADSLRHHVRIHTERTAQHSAQLHREINTSRLVLRDSTATLAMLRDRLDATVMHAERLAIATDSLLTSTRHLEQTLNAEREAWLAERTSSRDALRARDEVITGLERAARCRVAGLPCPTRTQLTLLVLVAALL